MTVPFYVSEVTSYRYGTGADDTALMRRNPAKPQRMTILRQLFLMEGARRSARGVLVAHFHRHPHVLLLIRAGSNQMVAPGGKLRPGETYEAGLARLLSQKVAFQDGNYEISGDNHVGTFYRAEFTNQLLPYLPVHVTVPKEIEQWYAVIMPDKGSIRVAPKYRLQAVAFYELQDPKQKEYDGQLRLIPTMLSRFSIIPRV